MLIYALASKSKLNIKNQIRIGVHASKPSLSSESELKEFKNKRYTWKSQLRCLLNIAIGFYLDILHYRAFLLIFALICVGLPKGLPPTRLAQTGPRWNVRSAPAAATCPGRRWRRSQTTARWRVAPVDNYRQLSSAGSTVSYKNCPSRWLAR